MMSAADLEPHLPLVPSVVFNGRRMRPLFDTFHSRPPNETFHEFLIAVVQWTVGETWWKHQLHLSEERRHVVMRWYEEYCKFTAVRTNVNHLQHDHVTYRSRASGAIWALLTLGYDLFCVQLKRELPAFVVGRLKDHEKFQAVRYEVAVAAILERTGFDIQYFDEEVVEGKHPEFLATHRTLPIKIAVEAKSRKRTGVMNTPGSFSYTRDARGLEQLLRKALKQRVAGVPLVVFVDVNMPPTPTLALVDKPWLSDIKGALTFLGAHDSADGFSALVVTNFAYHFGQPTESRPDPEWTIVLPPQIDARLDDRLLNFLAETVARYGVVPQQL